MGSKLFIDFECRSRVDLPKTGVHVYADDPSTEILCMGYAFDDEPVSLWTPEHPLPERIRHHVENWGAVVAHNAAFEIEIWNALIKTPVLAPEQCECVMMMCYAMALPGSLEKASLAVGISNQKDMRGHRIMMRLSKPTASGEYDNDPGKFLDLYEYCLKDVEAQRELYKRVLKLTPAEKSLWVLDQTINRRGIPVDIESAKKAVEVIEEEKKRLDGEIRKVTENAVASCSAVGQLTNWIALDKNIPLEGVAKEEVTELLARPDLPKDVREALLIRREFAKSSTSKLISMVRGAGPDSRVRGTMQSHGATTGRWAGRRIQIQNFPRMKAKPKKVEEIFDLLNSHLSPKETADGISMLYGTTMSTISDVLRAFIKAPEGISFLCADFSSIEARVLAWLADEKRVLDIFRGDGKVYEAAAAAIYRISIEQVTDAQRQIGKVAVLALGFAGGKGAFQKMATVYGVDVTDSQAEAIKVKWREAHPKIVRYWSDLESAAMSAVRHPGNTFSVGEGNRKVSYKMAGSFLFCRLPSKRVLCYPYPKIELHEAPWGDMVPGLVYKTEDQTIREWGYTKAWRGILVENIVQAVARDFLTEAMQRLEANDFPITFHVHDEIVCERSKGQEDFDRFIHIMKMVPDWARDFPMDASGWVGDRYRK